MAGGETRDTVPKILEMVAGHTEVDAVLFLGLGIQSNTAAMMRRGPFFPDHGLRRIVNFHETQDARYAEAARRYRQTHEHSGAGGHRTNEHAPLKRLAQPQ